MDLVVLLGLSCQLLSLRPDHRHLLFLLFRTFKLFYLNLLFLHSCFVLFLISLQSVMTDLLIQLLNILNQKLSHLLPLLNVLANLLLHTNNFLPIKKIVRHIYPQLIHKPLQISLSIFQVPLRINLLILRNLLILQNTRYVLSNCLLIKMRQFIESQLLILQTRQSSNRLPPNLHLPTVPAPHTQPQVDTTALHALKFNLISQ